MTDREAEVIACAKRLVSATRELHWFVNDEAAAQRNKWDTWAKAQARVLTARARVTECSLDLAAAVDWLDNERSAP